MKFTALRYFVAVAEALSFSRAAEELNISQSALSRQIKLLEEDLGAQLFDRIGRRIELTHVGDDMLWRCRALLEEAHQLDSRVRSLARGEHGLLRIGATPQTLESVLAVFLRTFLKSAPGLQVTLIEDGSNRLEERVISGELDLSVGGRSQGSALHGTALFPLGVLAVLPGEHSRTGARMVDIVQLAREPLLQLRPTFMTRQMFDGFCRIANFAPRVVIESGSPHSLLALVRAQLGIAIVPSTVILGDLRESAVPVVFEGRQIGFDIHVNWDPRRQRSPAARQFIDALYAATRRDYPGRSFGFSMADG